MPSKVWSLDIDGKPFISRQEGPRQFRCVFDVEVRSGDSLSLADIRLYNLSEDTGIDQRSSVLFRAGDESVEDVIFMGYVTNSFRERQPGSTDTALRLICKSGAPTGDRGSIQKSFGKGTSVVDVVRALAQSWPIPLDIDVSHFSDDPLLVSGFVTDGDIPAALDDLAYAYGFIWVQELGRLVVTKPNMERSVVGTLQVNQYTGMVGMPEVTRGPNGLGVYVSTRLNPFVKLNSKIDVQSKYSTFNTGNLYIQELTGEAAATGLYNVFGLHHRGDTHGDLWVTDIDGIRTGTIAAPADLAEGDVLIWGQRVDEAFKGKVRTMSKALAADPNWLMAVMAFETGETFAPDEPNRGGSGAVGLIQFMPDTALGLGTTTAKLSRMTAVAQLDYVAKYYARFANRMQNLGDAYLAVLWPPAVGRADSYVMWERDTGDYQRQYNANKNLDVNKDGKITRAEAISFVTKSFRDGRSYEG